MTQPTDRLGQPLSVGDWVVFNSLYDRNFELNGKLMQIDGFNFSRLIVRQTGKLNRYPSAVCCGKNFSVGALTKINPKPKTTTWNKMADIWTPEGVKP